MSEPNVQYVVDKQGKKTGVFLSFVKYQRLMEDLNDLSVVASRRNEKPITMTELKKRLRYKGRVWPLIQTLL